MKINKKLLITAGAVTVAGAAVAGTAAALIISSSADSVGYESKIIEEKVSKIIVNAAVSDVRFISGNSDKIYVSYPTEGVSGSVIEVDGDTLKISYDRSKKQWHEYIGLDFGYDNEILIEIPKDMSIDAQLETGYGDIEAAGVIGSLRAEAEHGDVEVSYCEFNTLECSVDYGDIEIKNSTAKSVSCINSHGDIEFERLDGDLIELTAALGDIEGYLAGRETDYTINADAELGGNNLINRTGGEKILNLKDCMGDIEIMFGG